MSELARLRSLILRREICAETLADLARLAAAYRELGAACCAADIERRVGYYRVVLGEEA